MTNEEMNWFRRGGKRPEPTPKAPIVDHQICGSDIIADEKQYTQYNAHADFHDFIKRLAAPSEPAAGKYDRSFFVTMERTVTVRQTATVRVDADSRESAMDRAEALAEDDSGRWCWTDIPGTTDYEDCEAVDAGEVGGL